MKSWLVLFFFAVAQITQAQESAVSLSLRECIERALQNNLDISIERINPKIEDASVLAAYGDFDPHLSLNVLHSNIETPLFVVQTNNAASQTISTTITPRLSGKLPIGTQYGFAYNSAEQQTSPSFEDQYKAVGSISVTQPMLRNFGLGPNLASLRIARKNTQVAYYTLVTKMTDTVNQVHKSYFDLIFSIENVKVQQESLELAKALLAENRKRLEVGMMSPIDVTQAESGVASQEEALIQAQQDIRNQANILRRLISSDVAPLLATRIIPVDTPTVEPVKVNVDESIKIGLQQRPEYLQQRHQIEANQIQLRFDRNQLFPQIDVTGSYGRAGLTKTFAGAFDQAASSQGSPQWTVGVVVDIPLGDLQARGNYRSSKLKVGQSILQLKNTEQNIIVDVDNTAAQVLTNLKRIDATAAARRLAEETLNAERKKLQAGTSTSYTVLQHQRDRTDARSKEIRAIADYNKSLADFYRAQGTLLQKDNIDVKPD